MTNEPMIVAIYCLVYNHEHYLRDCFEGFVKQETNFRYVAIVHDDCSTDGSQTIIREYESKYPDIFLPIYETENQYKKIGLGGLNRIMDSAIKETGAKYVAICEGDDYWTDPLKLQKQVDFLESHPEYSVTFHRCKHLNERNGELRDDNCGLLFPDKADGVDVDLSMFFTRWYTQPLTMVFRESCSDMYDAERYKNYRDTHLIYHLLKEGKGYLFAFEGGVRMIHEGGMSSQRTSEQQCTEALVIAEEIYQANRDKYTKQYYLKILQWAIDNATGFGYSKWKLSWNEFRVNRSLIRLFKNIIR